MEPICKHQQVSLVGRVAAGTSILASEQIEDWLPVKHSNPHDTLFALRVTGDSMIGANIVEF